MKKFLLIGVCAFGLVACGGSETPTDSNEKTTRTEVTEPVEVPKVDLSAAPSGAYTIDKGHGYITFTYLHQGYSKPYVRWRDWDSTLNWNLENPSLSTVSVAINASSIDSGVDKFDDHLKSADFFEVETYPTINFASTSMTTTGPNTGTMTGDLTIKNTTKPVTLEVTFNKAGEMRGGGNKIGFSATGSVKRSDFGVDLYVPYVGDDVDLVIEVEYEKSE